MKKNRLTAFILTVLMSLTMFIGAPITIQAADEEQVAEIIINKVEGDVVIRNREGRDQSKRYDPLHTRKL